jgi:hypothetical protein
MRVKEVMRRSAQHRGETAIEYIRRVASNSAYEYESFWDDLPSVEACFEYFELWHAYDTEYWVGIREAIAEGDDPAKAKAFLRRWKLTHKWLLSDAVALGKKARLAKASK